MPTDAPAGPVETCTCRKPRQRLVELPKYVRKVKGKKYQPRLWLGRGVQPALGLHRSEYDAARVALAVVHEMQRHPLTPRGVWEAVRAVARRGTTHTGRALCDDSIRSMLRLLPLWVTRTAGGKYTARVRKNGISVRVGYYADPGAASDAITQEFLQALEERRQERRAARLLLAPPQPRRKRCRCGGCGVSAAQSAPPNPPAAGPGRSAE